MVRRALVDAFGTADTEALGKLGIPVEQMIERLVTQLEKLPRVTGGVANDLENFADRAQRAIMPLGQGLIVALQTVSPFVERVLDNLERRMNDFGTIIAAIARSGLLERMLTPLLNVFGLISDGAESLVASFRMIGGGAETAGQQIESLRQQVWAADAAVQGLAQNGQAAMTPFVEGAINGIATLVAIISNIPTAFQQVKAYTHDVFTTIKEDVSQVGEWFKNIYNAIDLNTGLLVFQLEQRWAHLIGQIEDQFKGITRRVAEMVQMAGDAVAALTGQDSNPASRLAARMTAYASQPTYIPEITPFAFFPTPTLQDLGRQLKPLPDFPNIDLLAGRQSIFDSIANAYRPLDLVPEGLTFGGRRGNAPSHAESLLGQIEGHTRRAANALDPTSLRRQAIGTGPLSALGATPAELQGGATLGRTRAAGVRGSYGGDDLMRQLANTINAMAERKAREILRRQTGAGFSGR